MKERIVIVFVAIILGLIITTAGFFIYQTTQQLPPDEPTAAQTKTAGASDTNDEESGFFLKVDEPLDESVATTRTIQVKGKTNPDNIIVVSTNQEDATGSPSKDGQFSMSVTIDTGTNKILTRVISPTGEEKIDERIVTYTTEEF